MHCLVNEDSSIKNARNKEERCVMKKLTRMFLLLIIFSFSMSKTVLAVYELKTIEEWISASDLIVYGKVIKSNIYYNNDEIIRLSTISIDQKIKNSIEEKNDQITIESSEGVINGKTIQKYDFRPDLKVDSNVIIILFRKSNGNYDIAGAVRGLFYVSDGIISGTQTSLDEFIDSIKSLINQKQQKIGVDIPSFEEQLTHNDFLGKIADTGYHISDEFYGRDDYGVTDRTIEFKINPTYAFDYEGNRILFEDIKAAVEDCLAQWNKSNVPCDNVNFTVSPDSPTQK